MKNRRFFPLLLAGLLTVSGSATAYAASADAQIADIQAQKSEAEASLAQAQGNISSLEGRKQELEGYLAELNTQYDELTSSISQLSIQAAQKEDELKDLKLELRAAQKTSEKQYEAMKKRIVYMYENGGASMLELLLSSKDLGEFMNRAENISQLSQYDREMLTKYEELQKGIEEQKARLEEEAEAVNDLLAESSAKKQEVQAMVSSTNESISSYISQISASQEEADALAAQISSADNSIYNLMQQAEAERAAAEQETYEETSGETYEEASGEAADSYEEDSAAEEESNLDTGSVEASEQESYEDTASESTGGDSGQGTYLGNFVLTAYCNCAQCCGTAGNATASGTMPSAGRTVAMAGVPFGTQLLINGNVYTVEDLGTPYGHVDIYFGSHSEALNFGLQYADVYQLG